MARKKVKLAFIKNLNDRKVSYKKRQKGFLKKSDELSTLCDVKMAGVIYSPYHNEPEVFPNHDAVINTFTTFKGLPEEEQSKNMVTQEKFTEQRIEKMEKQLWRVRKENKIREFTNKMYEGLNGEDIPTGMHAYDLNDLSYIINQNLKQVCEALKAKADGEGSTSHAPLFTPVFPQMMPQMNPLMNIPMLNASVPMTNYQNNSVSFPQSPPLSEMFDWKDEVMTLLDEPSFNNINVRDSNNNNNNS